ncbi:FAD linked oxidase domain protein [Chthoniobacter flavus Ellin428]|uniref:FAD linked oxidase domain protein n=2 Tax=Chthoniobacter flavus TaxID=191863 RepID=B4D8P0_9BACT|nr:FAD linked oxidase domain protein [Chthoniobacter flavus Ellin428]TCO86915.1 FAD/FMN-containing dehydrogenase [Chthoniobacter flavus]
MLPFGLGRSYGDSCLNDGGDLLVTEELKHLLAFDAERGMMRCEAGVTLDELLRFIVPRGWFLPVTPGTKFITVGGAIANDIHGKNHHRAGTFGCHVTKFELLRSTGERLICSPTENTAQFAATIGGLGLTGLITWAEFQLLRIENSMIDVEELQFANLDEFFAISAESDADFAYTVSWVDCLAEGPSLGRGIFMRGNHARGDSLSHRLHRPPRLGVPVEFPDFALNQYSIQAFNTLYYAKALEAFSRKIVHYDPFFYPLDAVNHWNRIYGRRGFFQYQFVIPFSGDRKVIREIFQRIAASGQGSFLAVLKTFGERRSPGMLSFPAPGLTLALDFANQGWETLSLFNELDQVVLATGGRIYPAKDARMPARVFQECYPRWEEFRQYIDPAFSSSFWRRVNSPV